MVDSISELTSEREIHGWDIGESLGASLHAPSAIRYTPMLCLFLPARMQFYLMGNKHHWKYNKGNPPVRVYRPIGATCKAATGGPQSSVAAQETCPTSVQACLAEVHVARGACSVPGGFRFHICKESCTRCAAVVYCFPIVKPLPCGCVRGLVLRYHGGVSQLASENLRSME